MKFINKLIRSAIWGGLVFLFLLVTPKTLISQVFAISVTVEGPSTAYMGYPLYYKITVTESPPPPGTFVPYRTLFVNFKGSDIGRFDQVTSDNNGSCNRADHLIKCSLSPISLSTISLRIMPQNVGDYDLSSGDALFSNAPVTYVKLKTTSIQENPNKMSKIGETPADLGSALLKNEASVSPLPSPPTPSTLGPKGRPDLRQADAMMRDVGERMAVITRYTTQNIAADTPQAQTELKLQLNQTMQKITQKYAQAVLPAPQNTLSGQAGAKIAPVHPENQYTVQGLGAQDQTQNTLTAKAAQFLEAPCEQGVKDLTKCGERFCFINYGEEKTSCDYKIEAAKKSPVNAAILGASGLEDLYICRWNKKMEVLHQCPNGTRMIQDDGYRYYCDSEIPTQNIQNPFCAEGYEMTLLSPTRLVCMMPDCAAPHGIRWSYGNDEVCCGIVPSGVPNIPAPGVVSDGLIH